MTEHDLQHCIRGKKAVIFDLFHTLTALESTWGDDRPFTYQVLGVGKQAWDDQLQKLSRDRLTGKQKDAFAIVAAGGELHGLNASGRAPAGWTGAH